MAKEDIEKKIIDSIMNATQYGGNKSVNKKAISASELQKDIKQIYLRYMHGIRDETKPSVSSIGSLIHLALEDIMKDKKVLTEHSMEYLFEDLGWSLTGTADLIIDDYIVDYKSVKYYWNSKKQKTIDKVLSYDDDRNVQLSILRYLYKKLYNKDMKIGLFFIFRDTGLDFENGFMIPPFKFVDTTSYAMPYDSVEKRFRNKVDLLLRYIEKGEEPPECDDIMWRKVAGRSVPTRCVHYCSFADVCASRAKKSKSSYSDLGSKLNQLNAF